MKQIDFKNGRTLNIILVTAFTNMYGSGGAPLFSMARGKGEKEEAAAIQNTSFFLLIATSVPLFLIGELFGEPILRLIWS